jgi:hypothetical protein
LAAWVIKTTQRIRFSVPSSRSPDTERASRESDSSLDNIEIQALLKELTAEKDGRTAPKNRKPRHIK